MADNGRCGGRRLPLVGVEDGRHGRESWAGVRVEFLVRIEYMVKIRI